MIFAKNNLWGIAILFAFAAITDFLDGQIARRFGMETELGRKLDMIADRFLMIGTVFAFVIVFTRDGQLDKIHLFQIFLFMAREIISFPFAIIAFVSGWPIPKARYVAKINTVIQGFGFSFLIMSLRYEIFNFSIYFAVASGFLGLISAVYYINDITGYSVVDGRNIIKNVSNKRR